MKRIFAFIVVSAIVFAAFPLNIFAANPTIICESISAKQGDNITLKVRVRNNPGITFMRLTPHYNDSIMTLLDVDFLSAEVTFGNTEYTPRHIIFENTFDVTGDGIVFTMRFKILDDAGTGDYQINLIVREAYNYDGHDIIFNTIPGKVNVVSLNYGDVNSDGMISGKDLIRLRKYLAAYNDETGTADVDIGSGADVNGDGAVNGKDIIRLRKYLQGDTTLLDPPECDSHNWSDWQTVTNPNCTEEGSKKRTCLTCGKTEIESIPALGHDYVVETITPTCTQPGTNRYTCTVCGKIEEETLPALGHNYITETVSPTCTEQGYISHTCINCGDIYKNNYISALGHDYGTDNRCKICGAIKASPDECFIFTLLTDETYEIKAKSKTDLPETLVIPEQYSGKPVTKIANNAFKGCEGITEVIMPGTITSIGDYAFKDCSNIESINIPYAVTNIGRDWISGVPVEILRIEKNDVNVFVGEYFGSVNNHVIDLENNIYNFAGHFETYEEPVGSVSIYNPGIGIIYGPRYIYVKQRLLPYNRWFESKNGTMVFANGKADSYNLYYYEVEIGSAYPPDPYPIKIRCDYYAMEGTFYLIPETLNTIEISADSQFTESTLLGYLENIVIVRY